MRTNDSLTSFAPGAAEATGSDCTVPGFGAAAAAPAGRVSAAAAMTSEISEGLVVIPSPETLDGQSPRPSERPGRYKTLPQHVSIRVTLLGRYEVIGSMSRHEVIGSSRRAIGSMKKMASA